MLSIKQNHISHTLGSQWTKGPSPYLHSAQHPEVVDDSFPDDVHVSSDKLNVALAEVGPIAGHVGHLIQFVEEAAHHGSLVMGREFAQGFLQDCDQLPHQLRSHVEGSLLYLLIYLGVVFVLKQQSFV